MARRKSRGAKKKELWFQRGIEALQLARPGVSQGLYCCPLCIRGFDSLSDLSFEDVPPRNVGGRWVCLTCRCCNSRSGHQLDHHVRKAADLREFSEGLRELRATLMADGKRVTATVRKTRDGLSFAGLPEHSNKEHHTEFFSRLDRAALSGSRDWGFDVSIRAGYDHRAENLSWLRAGYLIAFAAFGYTYVMRQELEQLRQQLANPEKEIIPYFKAHATGNDVTENRLAIVFEPAELRSVYVQFGDRLVLLPDFTACSDFFDRLKGLHAGARSQQLVVLPIQWPVEPLLNLDFEPRFLPRCLPTSLSWWRNRGA